MKRLHALSHELKLRTLTCNMWLIQTDDLQDKHSLSGQRSWKGHLCIWVGGNCFLSLFVLSALPPRKQHSCVRRATAMMTVMVAEMAVTSNIDKTNLPFWQKKAKIHRGNLHYSLFFSSHFPQNTPNHRELEIAQKTKTSAFQPKHQNQSLEAKIAERITERRGLDKEIIEHHV